MYNSPNPNPAQSQFEYDSGDDNRLIALIFDGESQAQELLSSVKNLEKQGFIKLEDAVAAVKDKDGKVKVQETADKSDKRGTRGGGVLGLTIGLILGGPIVGLAAGLLGGRAIGKLVDSGVDESFIKEVAEAMSPGNSALFLLIESVSNPGVVWSTLEGVKAKVYQTTLPDEVEERLRKVLEG